MLPSRKGTDDRSLCLGSHLARIPNIYRINKVVCASFRLTAKFPLYSRPQVSCHYAASLRLCAAVHIFICFRCTGSPSSSSCMCAASLSASFASCELPRRSGLLPLFCSHRWNTCHYHTYFDHREYSLHYIARHCCGDCCDGKKYVCHDNDYNDRLSNYCPGTRTKTSQDSKVGPQTNGSGLLARHICTWGQTG